MSRSVDQWLVELGLSQYADGFAKNDIDLDILPRLTSEDLRDIGVTSVGHRRRILDALKGMSGTEAVARSPEAGLPAEMLDATRDATPETTRRQVSVLFADLSGFTRLSASLDAEETHALLNGFFAAVGEIVSRYGGVVDKHIGDAVMAVFGAPTAHTDDPERALRAAIDIHAAVAALTPPLQVHVGVASGQVIASATGSAEHTEYTVTGDSVNLAARLTDLAKADETLVSASIRRALGEAFVGETLGEQLIEGLPEPVTVWRLEEVTDPAEIGRRPFVGRRAEREAFAGTLDKCVDEHKGEVFVVRGEAGIGKTRLSEELERMAGARGFATHSGLVLDFGTAKGQDAVRALTRSLLEIEPNTGKHRRAEIAEEAFASGALNEERRAYLNDLLDLDQTAALRGLYDAMDNAARNAGKQATLAELACFASRERPVLLKIEDLHWASPIVLAHAAHLARLTAEAPVILLMTTRLTGDPFDDDWRADCGDARFLDLALAPMETAEAGAIASSFVDVDEALARSCVERAGGNPLLLEQLLYNADEVGAGALPGSVQTIVQARLDALPEDERQALQAASVLGQRFSGAAVEAIAGRGFQPETLIGQALIRRAGNDFHFAHALIREGVYESLLRTRRAELHRRAAAFFRGRDADLQAQHLDQAGDPEAPVAYLAAARLQKERLRLDAALAAATRALEIDTPRTPRFELACFRGDLLRDLGRSVESLEAFEMALGLVERDEDLCRANLGLAAAMRIVNRTEEAFDCLERAQALAEKEGMKLALAEIHFLRGNLFFPSGRIKECRTEHEASLHYARAVGSQEAEARALGGLGDAAYAAGRVRTAHDYFKRCIAIASENQLLRIEVANLPMKGWMDFFMCRIGPAEAEAHQAIEKANAISETRARIIANNLLLEVSTVRGDFEAAGKYAKNIAMFADQIGAPIFAWNSKMGMARHVAYVEGDRARAFALLAELYDSKKEAGVSFMGPWVLGSAALVATTEADRRWALNEGERILKTGAVSHNYLRFYADAMDACREAGDWDEALRYADALESYTSEEPVEWSGFFTGRVRALAAFASGRQDQELRNELVALRTFAIDRSFTSYLPAIEEAISDLG